IRRVSRFQAPDAKSTRRREQGVGGVTRPPRASASSRMVPPAPSTFGTAGDASSPRESLQRRRRLIDRLGLGLEHASYPRDLLLRLRPAVLLDRLTHPRQGLDPVTGVEPGRVDLVPEPGPPGESVLERELAFGTDERSEERRVGREGRSAWSRGD